MKIPVTIRYCSSTRFVVLAVLWLVVVSGESYSNDGQWTRQNELPVSRQGLESLLASLNTENLSGLVGAIKAESGGQMINQIHAMLLDSAPRPDKPTRDNRAQRTLRGAFMVFPRVTEPAIYGPVLKLYLDDSDTHIVYFAARSLIEASPDSYCPVVSQFIERDLNTLLPQFDLGNKPLWRIMSLCGALVESKVACPDHRAQVGNTVRRLRTMRWDKPEAGAYFLRVEDGFTRGTN